MTWPKPSDELRMKLRKEIHRWKPWEHSRKKYTAEWAAHLRAICKKVDGFYSQAVADDKRRLRDAVQECEGLLMVSSQDKNPCSKQSK